MQQRWPPTVHPEHQIQLKGDEAPRLIEISPIKGKQGTVVTVVLQSLPHQLVPVKLAFNNLVVETKQMQGQGIISLVAVVPPFQQTRSATSIVPISICILDRDSVTETWPVAEFTYESETEGSNTTSTLTSTSNEPLDVDYSNNKNENDVPPNLYSSRTENFLNEPSNVSYEEFYQQPLTDYNSMNDSQMPQYSYQYNSINRRGYNDNKYIYPVVNGSRTAGNVSSQSINIEYAENNSSNGLFGDNNVSFTGVLAGFSQGVPSSSSVGLSQQVGTISFGQPDSQNNQSQSLSGPSITQKPIPSPSYRLSKPSFHIPSTSVANYQPYPGLISRASLKLMGDLDSMAKNWAPEEWANRRRLVQFWREQKDVEIQCTFDPVSQGERILTNNGHIVVSCIYWEERNDCFITSVDCIHLLESLMDIRFSVEEKNRVRRNLEGFRPLTVSKCKAESADFFKLIMGFPNPKPRNIEKDVKVFPWKTLPYALKKIVTKYTASSSNNVGSQPQQRRTQVTKNSVNTPTDTVPTTSSASASYMCSPSTTETNIANQKNDINSFYSQPGLCQPPQHCNAYQSSVPSIYQPPTSINSYSSTYRQPQSTQALLSPTITSVPSPELQYPLKNLADQNNDFPTTISSSEPLDTVLAATALSSLYQDGIPCSNRRTSFINQQENIYFKTE
ncbi:hypothetical protein BD770DRAFT_386700 [Pilaira anomala]|nr:hypothetical protein BD770DRAFT_386700 [Pilaira anomala]